MLISRRLKAVACLLLWSNVASAGLVHPQLRFRADTTAIAATASNTANTNANTAAAATATATDAAASESSSQTATAKTTSKSATDDASATSSSDPTSIITSISAATTTSSLNSTLFNSNKTATIPAGQLPLQPTVTPAYGVAGIILLATGVVFALVGVRKRWLQTFFSTAYLGALGTTVLILYVMSLPISSNAVQGAYLVAVVATGLILGSLAIVFKEIAEGFGCLLGGFCLGMWLMCLRPGGLIQSNAGSIGFIVGFTVCAYAFYFSHYTRHHALMVCIAFGGATAAVLGIDCFSRAGLKEFWAYVWNLNDDLFPLGTVTYPITRGIKVELAAIILIFCAGIVSQLKLWRLVQERRAKRDADRLADEQNLAKEEEKVGREIEAANARDREEWEAVYGDGTYVPGTVPPAAPGSSTAGEGDSGISDVDSEKGEKSEKKKSNRNGDASSSSQNSNDEIEMDNMQPKGAAEVVMEQDEKDGAIMVRVAQDEYPEGLPAELEAEAVASSQRAVHPSSAEPATAEPGIVPLPFTVPSKGGDHDNDDNNDKASHRSERSSVATFADEDEVVPSATARRRPQSPQSPSNLAKRLSQGSTGLFRSISQRSKRASAALDEAMGGNAAANGQSKEELVSRRASAMMIRQVPDEADDNSSIAATMDGLSSDGEDEVNEIKDEAKEIEVKAQLSSEADASSLKPPQSTAEKHLSAATASTDIEKRLSQDKSAVESVASSTPANLKDRLPRSMSRVAMSYRTNEWAKHLSNADAPEFETLQLGEPVVASSAPRAAAPASPLSGVSPTNASPAAFATEAAAPVNLADLQQTAETGTPAPAAPRTASVYGALSRSNSHQSLSPAQAIPNASYNPLKIDTSNAINSLPSRNSFSGSPGAAIGAGSVANGWRSSSANQIMSARGAGLLHEPITEEDTVHGGSVVGSVDDVNNRNTPTPPTPSNRGSLPPVPGVVSFNTPQTLIGQREMLLRSKSQQGMYIGGSVVRSASAASIPGLHNSFSQSQLPPITSGASDAGSIHGGMYNPATQAPASTPVQDLDDLPMSQRREMMRQSSLMSLSGPGGPASPTSPSGAIPASTIPFDSHQPKRDQQHLPTAAARQAQLATFRNSVAADLRSGMGNAPNTVTATGGRLRESMSTPYVQAQSPNQYGSTPFLNQYGSMASLQNVNMQGQQETLANAQSQMDLQRQFLISQKGAEAQRREMERLEKERANQAFEERMRRGDLLGAHRDAMRKMQAQTK